LARREASNKWHQSVGGGIWLNGLGTLTTRLILKVQMIGVSLWFRVWLLVFVKLFHKRNLLCFILSSAIKSVELSLKQIASANDLV
jgi:hypothetical protein